MVTNFEKMKTYYLIEEYASDGKTYKKLNNYRFNTKAEADAFYNSLTKGKGKYYVRHKIG